MHANQPSILIYDGDCGICREWVENWRHFTGADVSYRSYQESAAEYPDISLDEFESAIQLIEPDGTRSSGARATYKLYRNRPPYSLLARLYDYLPGFAPISEACYGFLSGHRSLLAMITHLFWGRNFRPPSYGLTAWIFLRILGLTYLSAFLSFYVQVTGLIGADGILPLTSYLDAARSALGASAYYQLPMIFWISASDAVLEVVCLAGAALAVCLVFNVLNIISLALLFILYLSLVYAGQQFMSFQWDMLLLEAGLLALFLRGGSHVVVWLYRWLVFRFMFLGGMVKLINRDPTWDNLTALHFHFETQPLPAPPAWQAHHLPDLVLNLGVAATLITELLIPFLIFTPRRFRIMAAWCFILFQTCIILTGNYNFFNLLTIALCLFLFDDAALKKSLPGFLRSRLQAAEMPAAGRTISVTLLYLFAAIVVYVSTEQLYLALHRDGGKAPSALTSWLAPLRAINNYGPFAVMTTVRNEIEIEGSHDGRTWQAYEFRYKPGVLNGKLSWIIPHQPRLDWQMWFAALSSPERTGWFQNLMVRLLQNKHAVTDLLARNPFVDAPPAFIRALFYEYRFTTPPERKSSGNIWTRKLVTEYYPAVRLDHGSR